VNDQIWWYVARSTGIVALVCLILSFVWGVMLATRIFKPHDRPAWLLDLHGWLGGLAVTMTALHLTGLVLDGYVHFGAAEILVPGASSYRPVAVAVGVVSTYLLVAVQVTAMLRRRLPKRVWRGVHLASYLVVWGGLVHAGMAGTDVANWVYRVLALALTGVAMIAAITAVIDRSVLPATTRSRRGSAADIAPPAARTSRASTGRDRDEHSANSLIKH
jgi:predicted ferric reductase